MIKRDAANASFHIPLLPGGKGKRGDKGDKKGKVQFRHIYEELR